MKQVEELKHYDEVKDWNFDEFNIKSESLTNWELYDILANIATKDSRILDLGTGGGEKVLQRFPVVKEILATDFSEEMLKTANRILVKSGRTDVTFRFMNNLEMDTPDDYFDIVVARNTVTDPKQIYKTLKPGGTLLVHGVDMHDCWDLKLLFGKGQGFHDKKPISVVDFENIIKAGFKDVELVPICEREYFDDVEKFKKFLKKVPILQDFSEEDCSNEKHHYTPEIDEELLDKYIKENTSNGLVKLRRRYYGISAKK